MLDCSEKQAYIDVQCPSKSNDKGPDCFKASFAPNSCKPAIERAFSFAR